MENLIGVVLDRIISDLNKLRTTPVEKILETLEKFWIAELSVILGTELLKKETLEKIMKAGVEESTTYIMDYLKNRVEITKNKLFVMSVISAASMINRIFKCLKTSSDLCGSCPVKDECPLSKPSSESNPFANFGDDEGGNA